MPNEGITCAGNWILDMVHTVPLWPKKSGLARITAQHAGLGGGPANVACALKAMQVGYPVQPVGLIGAGALGDEVIRLCDEAGLPVDRLARTPKAATAQTHVMSVPGDSRTFFYYPGASDLLDAVTVDVATLTPTRLFYLGYVTLLAGLDQIGPDGRTAAADVLAEARARGMTTCVDLASEQSDAYRKIVESTLPEIDYLFLNELEASLATGLPVPEAADSHGMAQAASALKSGGAKLAVIVHSPKCIVWQGDGGAQVFTPEPIPPEGIVSAVGAGDAFTAGVLHGIHEGWDPDASVHLGMRAAAASLGGHTATDGLRGFSI